MDMAIHLSTTLSLGLHTYALAPPRGGLEELKEELLTAHLPRLIRTGNAQVPRGRVCCRRGAFGRNVGADGPEALFELLVEMGLAGDAVDTRTPCHMHRGPGWR